MTWNLSPAAIWLIIMCTRQYAHFLTVMEASFFLGVHDDGTIKGIDPEAEVQIRKDFITAINNPQKISPPTYLSIDNVEIEKKKGYAYLCSRELSGAPL